MDSFSEQLVNKTEDPSDGMKRIGILALGTAAVFGLLYVTFVITPFALPAIALVIYGMYYFISGLSVEYEYIVSNEFLDIDKIICKRKRVNLLSVNIREFTAFGSYNGEDFGGTTIMAAGGDDAPMFADFESDRYGISRLVFCPNEKTLKNIRLYLSRRIKEK